jgi:hypothetical protein
VKEGGKGDRLRLQEVHTKSAPRPVQNTNFPQPCSVRSSTQALRGAGREAHLTPSRPTLP